MTGGTATLLPCREAFEKWFDAPLTLGYVDTDVLRENREAFFETFRAAWNTRTPSGNELVEKLEARISENNTRINPYDATALFENQGLQKAIAIVRSHTAAPDVTGLTRDQMIEDCFAPRHNTLLAGHHPTAAPDVVERVARIIAPGFFDEAAKGWEPEHAIEMQCKAREKAKAAIAAMKGQPT
jgi:hypothetical protein